ncbi:MAG: Lrp/AsnC family transcriptional regulator [Pseudomonadota bacterium]
MDEVDLKLIALLRNDARCPVAALARQLGVSRATIRSRITRLLERGVIRGFTILVRESDVASTVRAVTLIAVEGNRAERVLRRLIGFPEVRRLHTTNGRWDIVAEIVADTLPEFDALLNRIRSSDGVTSTETSILLSSAKGAV